MSTLEHFIREWGYWAVFLGACVEGESVILLACYAAYQGHLSWLGIISIAFMGTLVADQGLFLLGRRHGARLLKRWPILQTKSEKIFYLLHRFDTWFILSFRFIYGIRVASPIILGTSGVALGRFARLNLIAAVIWTAVSFGVGYAAARSMNLILEHLSQIKNYALWGGVCIVSGWIGYRIWKRLSVRRSSQQS